MDTQRTISRLQAALMMIGNLPLEFNTRARAIAQEAIGDNPPGVFREPLTKEQIQKVLYRDSTFKVSATKPTEKEKENMSTATATEQAQAAPYIPPAIEMIPVESSNVESVGHDGDQILRVKFKNSGRAAYDYVGIMPEDFFGLINSESVGKAYNALVKEREIKGIKIEVPEA